MEKKKLIMFDFDGVLVDTFIICHGIDSEMNHATQTLEEYSSLFNGNIFEAKIEGRDIVTDDETFGKMYSERTREIKVPDEIKEMLRELSKEYQFAVVSSTHSRSIREILERENLLHYFDDICGSDVHFNKAWKIRSLLGQYGFRPEETVFVTDTSGDVYEAHECKVKSIAVTWGFQSKETIAASKPEVVVDSVAELFLAIKSHFSATI